MISAFLTIFISVFLAELGDKTQLATVLFSSENNTSRWLVFFASAGALITSTALAVGLGALAERYVTALPLKLIAGIGFILIGLWTVYDHFKG